MIPITCLLTATLIGLGPPPREAPMKLPALALTSPDGREVYLSADDFTAYDWGRHRFHLRPGVKHQLARRLLGDLVTGRAFVVVVGGERLYEGVFTSSLSSNTQAGVVIDLAPVDDDPSLMDLQLGYPSAAFYRGSDPRDDSRLRAALEELNKLK